MKARPICESSIDENGTRVWRVPLTHGKFALVDDQDIALVRKHNWRWFSERNIAGTSLLNKDGKYGSIGMHRLILNAPQEYEVDHKNGNGLDNRRVNIRLCNRSENMRNRTAWKLKPNSGSSAKGVHKLSDGRYRAQITLGTFESEQEAAQAYNKAAQFLFGEFARLNLADEDNSKSA
jgi:hypothetical protein